MPTFKVTLKRPVATIERATAYITAETQEEAQELAKMEEAHGALSWKETDASEAEIGAVSIEMCKLHAFEETAGGA